MRNTYISFMESISCLFFLISLCMVVQISDCNAQEREFNFYIDSLGEEQPIENNKELETKRLQVLDRMQEVMGALPDRNLLRTPRVKYVDSIKMGSYNRYTIALTVAADEQVSAYLYLPTLTDQSKKPAMLALHPTGALGKGIVDGQSDLPNRAYASEFAERGYVVIAPDYPSFGDQKDYDFETDRYVSGTMKGIFDNIRCIDFIQSLPMVDTTKIGVVGHSLGGHNAIFTAAFDKRLKVIISSCGWTPFHSYFNGDSVALANYGGKLWPWAQDKYMPLVRDKFNLDPDEMPFDFGEIIRTLYPRNFFSNSPLNDNNFNVQGVKNTIKKIKEADRKLTSKTNIEVHYPNSSHDFPEPVRKRAYQWTDSIFNYSFKSYTYLDNPYYKTRMAVFMKDKSPRDIVLLGNSLTERGDWNALLNRDDVANRGIGSDITQGFLERIDDVFDLKPKICFIEGGVNDIARHISEDEIINNLSLLVDTLRTKNIIPVLTSANLVAKNYAYMTPLAFNRMLLSLNARMRKLAEEKQVALIDLTPLIVEGGYTSKEYVVDDGIHYNSITYQMWARKIEDILKQVGHKLSLSRNE